MYTAAPSVLNVHTPSSSFAIIHSWTQESLTDLYDKLSRKTHIDYFGQQVGPGWLKYEYNGSVWDLDDDSDYTIFVWRQQEQKYNEISDAEPERVASSSRVTLPDKDGLLSSPSSPTLHLHDPTQPLPQPPAYCNPSYYVFRPDRAHYCLAHGLRGPSPSRGSKHSGKKPRNNAAGDEDLSGIPKLKRDFEKFHSENGVRTVMGSIGPVENVRMLLKSGHRHVYISRKFAVKHGFIPPDSAPGNYGYGGLLTIGEWPITLTPSSSSPNQNARNYINPDSFSKPPSPPLSHSPYSSPRINGVPHNSSLLMNGRAQSLRSNKSKKHRSNEDTAPRNGLKAVMIQVFLSEEPHFDVVLGRSFFEKRAIKVSSVDPTDVWCLDTGEKIECELVILKDGRGEIVTVT